VAAILAEIPVQVGRFWPWQPDSASHHFQKTARKAKLQQVRLHDLRHTYCTNLAAQGLAPWILQILMGHSDLKMTQRYVHLTPADLNKETK
jgi:site-specific recombinase XerD